MLEMRDDVHEMEAWQSDVSDASLRTQYGELVPGDRRAKLLTATMALVARNDLSIVTMDKIAEQAKVSRVTLYREFGNRRALFEAVIAYRLMQFDRRFFDNLEFPASLGVLTEDYLLASIRMTLQNPVTRRWAGGGLTFLRKGSLIDRVSEATWRPVLAHYAPASEASAMSTAEFAPWISTLQYSLSRLSVEAEFSEESVRKMIKMFVAPAIS